ncbi:MAG: histone deacetylase [Thermoleophilia bacterium]|nr:histone deacetylase [Thermoleophilia bacterium]
MELISHPELASLHPTGDHPERPDRIRALLEHFPGVAEAPEAGPDDLERCHEPDYVELIRSVAEPTWFDYDTVATSTSWRAARLASGAAMEAARTGGFALIRPPGHHALAARAMGFCLFNNVAVAARWAQAELGVGRVAVVDYDVHHGNGTQYLFAGDPSVLYASLHRWPFYPGTGGPDEQGETLVNVVLHPGAGDEELLAGFQAEVEPPLSRFAPDLLLVSAGFDAHLEDPISDTSVTEQGFRELSRRCAALAPRTAAVLEGGYNLATLPRLVEAALAGFEAET